MPLHTGNSSGEEYFEIEIIWWSDDFEPVTGYRSNRETGILLATVTVHSGINEDRHNKHNTYLIGICKKGGDHHAVESTIQNDIQNINQDNVKNKASHLKRRLQVKIKLISYLADSPECRNICALTRRNRNHTLRWGYISDNLNITSVLPAYENCFKEMVVRAKVTSIQCKKCVKGGFSDTKNHLTNFPSPKFYPLGLKDVKMGKIKETSITFYQLMQYCRISHEKLEMKHWSITNADAHLTLNVIHRELRDSDTERTTNFHKLKEEIDRGNRQRNNFKQIKK